MIILILSMIILIGETNIKVIHKHIYYLDTGGDDINGKTDIKVIHKHINYLLNTPLCNTIYI